MHFLLVDNAYEQNVACFWYSVLNAKVLVANFNREMALVVAFSMIVNFCEPSFEALLLAAQ